MFGSLQQSHLRIEIEATEVAIRDSLLRSEQFQKWMMPQTFATGLPEILQPNIKFISWIGPLSISHHVSKIESNELCLLLSEGVDGFHQWFWGDGWIQSYIEGISILPLGLGQTVSLFRLRQFLQS
jgi:hypothetical protein